MVEYEYRCKNCGEEFIVEQRMSDKPRKRCPLCKKHQLERLISTVFFWDTTPRTVGTQAEQNMRRMGQYSVDKQEKEYQESKKRSREELQRNLPKGMKLVNADTSSRWYGKMNKEVETKLQNATEQGPKEAESKIKKYIYEGKV